MITTQCFELICLKERMLRITQMSVQRLCKTLQRYCKTILYALQEKI